MKSVEVMTRRLHFLFSFGLSLTSTFSLGQVLQDSTSSAVSETFEYVREITPVDSTILIEDNKTNRIKDSVRYPLVSALSVYFDYPKLFSFFTEVENKAEVGFQVQVMEHILLVAELGRGRIRPARFFKNANYEVSGNYARVGIGYTKTLGAKSRLNIGFNYGSSFFNDRAVIEIEGPSGLFNSLEESIERNSLRGDWFEFTLGTESHLGKNLYLGFIGRLRVLNSYDSFEPLDVVAIPGYGRTFDSSIPAVNMYIKYKIQFY